MQTKVSTNVDEYSVKKCNAPMFFCCNNTYWKSQPCTLDHLLAQRNDEAFDTLGQIRYYAKGIKEPNAK